MGRTLPTQIQILREEEEAWRCYRRALRKEDQEAFDDVWSYARRHAMAASMASRLLPFEAHCLSMMVGLQQEIRGLKKQQHDFEISLRGRKNQEGG
ncbi:hypothetical protein BVX98_01840 [bacterium F11]|nr:hypothetical protein BVX98_01840 [bacterium F11]